MPDPAVTDPGTDATPDPALGRGLLLLDRVLAALVAATMFAMMAVVFVDVVGRDVFNAPLPGGFEIVEFLMPLAIFTALPLVTRDRQHITASLFEQWIRGRFKRALDQIILVFNVVVLGFVAWRMWVQGGQLAAADKISGFLEWPFAPIAYAIAVLAGLTALVQLLVILRPLAGARRD
jgi:TRAP-type C4-dicarboxylate transport system permease small subunit